ncbi:thiamine pyrophosphate enzyme, N-terminal TPP binding domain-containing protein [Epithele typhae]|uniref:thiamine pyrophosphate enzyme, N-terminal TPP binding domain-containing protein n=1 Tax=Epithele typhae TaxID=378194 RepID=UPI002007A6EC|nr:thiamine pyrophosphate enzyme, N-terminal TPP binding domain-containing protein [Epithele typhae]KAH9924660.1 thiamine pyrophosphate enzyme, N-terminal TPP binding domain-containing protein [Epithele typhae]
MYTAASVIFKTLAEAGVTHAFVNWGNDHPAFLEELERERQQEGGTRLAIVACPHEMVALSAAQGYAQVTGRPAAVIVHVDVGTQGLASAVHNVDRGRTPVFIFAGAAPQSSDARLKGTKNEWPMWLQDVPDQPSIVRQYMRFTSQIQSAKNAGPMIMRALQIASSEPKGPVYLWARRETTEDEVDGSQFQETLDVNKWPPAHSGALPDTALSTIVEALTTAQFPLIITANSGRNPKTVPLLSELSTILAIGVYTSCPTSVCVPWTHENYIGMSFGGKNEMLDHADVIILLDVDIPWIDTHGNKSRDDARVFIIDPDPLKTTMAWSHVDADLLCRADTEAALSQLVRAVDTSSLRATTAPLLSARQERLRALRAKWTDSLARTPSFVGETMTAAHVLGTLRAAIEAQTPSRGERVLWVNEATSNLPNVWAYLRPGQPGGMVGSGASGLGYALGASIGAVIGGAVAQRGLDMVGCIVGDGTFLFGVPATAYWLAKRQGTPFLTIILNNGGWASPRLSMLGVYPQGHGSKATMDELSVGFGPDMPDFAQVAVAAGGAWGKRISKADELQATLEEAIRVVLHEKRCAVVDCIVANVV